MSLSSNAPYFPGYSEEALSRALEIECYGLATQYIGGILVDGEYYLEGAHASCSLYLIPRDESKRIPYTTATFYSDCIAFEHEFPTLAFPLDDSVSNSDIPWNLVPIHLDEEDDRNPRHLYIEYLTYGAEMAENVANGPWVRPVFRYDRFLGQQESQMTDDGDVKVEWISRYGTVSLAIHLYNAALRQTDPLSKYLCYYRVIENVIGSNGKAWIEDQIGSLDASDLEPIWHEANTKAGVPEVLRPFIRDELLLDTGNRVNIVEVMRGHAQCQLARLRKCSTDTERSRRLYNENRCGIAHGREIKPHDLGDDFTSILNDLKIIRFLARLSISQTRRARSADMEL